jgi:hypothetical protein
MRSEESGGLSDSLVFEAVHENAGRSFVEQT